MRKTSGAVALAISLILYAAVPASAATWSVVPSPNLTQFDNVLWGGSVADPAAQEDSTRALRALAEHVRDDRRVDAVMLGVADGLLLARKRE